MRSKSAGPISEQLRAATAKSGRSQAAICREISINPAAMCRFMAGTKGLSLATLDRLARVLDLKVVSRGSHASGLEGR